MASPAAVVEPGPVPVRPRPAQAPGQWSAPPGQVAEVYPGSGPEVTISIGHIEVRSAPTADKPRSRPPFRPQVGLADFLSAGPAAMSDYRPSRGMSAVLCWLLSTALTDGGPTTILGATPGITAVSPDLITTGANEQPQVNLFMYYVSLNPALRNLDLPSSNAQGARLSNPPLALDLHYLVTAYGSTQFDPEILLAWAMKVFHETPVIASQTIQAALNELGKPPQANTEAGLISLGTLADQVEHIRITPEALTAQEICQLWTAFQAAYRPSAALQVSVVVIQDTQPFTSNRPVRHRVVTALPMQTPVISRPLAAHDPRGPGADHHREQLPRRQPGRHRGVRSTPAPAFRPTRCGAIWSRSRCPPR